MKQIASGTLLRRLAIVFMVVFVFFIATGCDFNFTGQAGVDAATLAALDDAIASLEADSSDWQAVLEKAIDDLPEDARQSVRTELTNLSTRTIAATGTEFRCNVDFLGARALEGLHRIRASFLGEGFQPTPTFCDLTPSAIDLDDPVTSRKKIEITGYNFDCTAKWFLTEFL